MIDFMNTRLQQRLTEPEILKIFSDVAEGVACMHYLKPPLLHRDLKVENVLITTTDGVRRFKLCDFGSTAPPRPAATSATECRLIEDDVQKHTTLQYRSPEMIDVYRKQPIDEKSDIWALGVLLYKLCYYTTPFEAQGQLAILNASFKFPSYPIFSDKLKKLIASMLQEHPVSRPNIYQVLREACLMQGIELPIKDIYAKRTQSETRRNQQLPTPENAASPPVIGAVYSPPAQQKQAIPDVVPMRRGRPTTGQQAHGPKPSPSPMRGTTSDPFAALDGKSAPVQEDELSSRFPSLDQFSLLHDGGKFDFDAGSPTSSSHKDTDQRETEKLADSAFVTPKSRTPVPTAAAAPPTSTVSRAQKIISSNPELQSVTSSSGVVYQPTPTRGPTSSYVSTGTMTSPSPPTAYIFPSPSDRHRSVSLPRNQEANSSRSQFLRPEGGLTVQTGSASPNPSYRPQLGHVRHPSSSRPSLEGGAPANEVLDPLVRAKSSNSQSRPTNTYLESNIEFLRERESSGRKSAENRRSTENRKSAEIRRSMDSRPSFPKEAITADPPSEEDKQHINSNVDFLRSMEDQEMSKKVKRRSTGTNNKPKRSSLPSMSLSGTKTLLAGKFGDAFKRFENNTSVQPGPRTPSPLQEMERRDLTPIAGSEATDGRSDDGSLVEENMSQEQRREIERRRLSMEEKRVADAAAEYRRQLASRGTTPRSIGGVSRATSIQNKVKTLLDESSQSSPVKKTAEGYGRYTEHAPAPQSNLFDQSNPYAKPTVARKPLMQAVLRGRGGQPQRDINYSDSRVEPIPAPSVVSKTGGPRPSAPPKPMHLNSISTGPQNSPPKQPSLPSRPIEARPDMTPQEKEDYIADFSKRFPSLSGIEMVEREIEMDNKKRDDGRSRSKVV